MSIISRSSLSNVHGGLARALGNKVDAPNPKNELGKLEKMLSKLAEALGGKNGAGDAQGKFKADKEDTLELLSKLLKMLGFPGSEEEILNQLKSLNPGSKDGKLQAGQQVRLPSPGGINGDSTFTPASTRSGPSLGGPSSIGPGSGVSGASGAAPLTNGQHAVGHDVPYINQLSPSGADGSYTNGAMNCGPTAMAMIARDMGFGAGMTDAQLINHLGQIGGTNSSEGTNVNGIVAMANAMGKNAQINQGTDTSWMVDQLRQGKQVVALGDFHAMPPHQDESRTSGHFVTVTGMDANGNFLVRDPADPNVRAVSPEQMAHFLGSHPAGGHQVAIG
ncbi:C39 family peptidase [Archangium violaceum]|uniref:C39 family peptidase n=1 Tax=Archangium violaceum TaxID=83451 RepID=UPI0019506E2E|nr:C39 family peptidase [Archangium violaceum]QRN98793.1 C39 family peptidase [Archangium violaceum]